MQNKIRTILTVTNPKFKSVLGNSVQEQHLPSQYNWKWRNFRNWVLTLSRDKIKQPLFVSFRPEFLGDDREEFTWLLHRVPAGELDLISGDIEECPFFDNDPNIQLFVPNGWVRGIKRLLFDGITGFTPDGHAILSSGEIAVYEPPYPSRVRAAAA